METKRVSNDLYGNPRYVVHFSNFLSRDENENMLKNIDIAYSRAKKIGGAKYRGKDVGGGVVFQSYNINDSIKKIREIVQEATL